MLFKNEYHDKWLAEIGWMLTQINAPATIVGNEMGLALAILRTTFDSMPTGIAVHRLQAITSAQIDDLQAIALSTAITPGLTYIFTLENDLAKLLPV